MIEIFIKKTSEGTRCWLSPNGFQPNPERVKVLPPFVDCSLTPQHWRDVQGHQVEVERIASMLTGLPFEDLRHIRFHQKVEGWVLDYR